MDEYAKQRMITLFAFICFCICVGMIIIGQKTVGFASITLMLIGLFGVLTLLYLYNRSQNK